jgi:hypothetical protein
MHSLCMPHQVKSVRDREGPVARHRPLAIIVCSQAKALYDCLCKTRDYLETTRKAVRFGEWTPHEIEVRHTLIVQLLKLMS